MKNEKRLLELDSMRGIAAIGIVFWHYSGHFHAQPLSWLFAPFYSAGILLVDFFFVLSGFVLARAYFQEDRRCKLSENIVRRVARIYPLHVITLILVCVGQLVLERVLHNPAFVYAHNDLFHFILNLGLLNFVGLQSGFSFNGPSWSISTEFYVNILFFVVIAFVRRPSIIFIGLILLSLTLLVGSEGKLIFEGDAFGLDSHLVRTMLGFFCGVTLYQMVRCSGKLVRSYLFDLSLLMSVFLLALACWLGFLGRVAYFDFSIVLVFYPVFIIAVLNGKIFPRVLRNKVFVHLGDVSYSVYLLHFPIQLIFHMVVTAGIVSINYDNPLLLGAFIFMTIFLASIVYYFVEVPLQNTINRWWARKRMNDVLLPRANPLSQTR